MYMGKSIAAIVPARGGSKGLPGKNLRLLGGKPLIMHTIDCARMSGICDLIAVSTDSEDIASAVSATDVMVINRPSELATDESKGVDVFVHAVKVIEDTEGVFDYYFYLQPTSPLRLPGDITGAMDLALERNADNVVGVTPCEHHPFWSGILGPDGSMEEFIKPGIQGRNRQELPPFYRINGAIYLAARRNSFSGFSFVTKETFAYVMPNERSVDIDTRLDLALAEVLLRESQIS